MEEQLLAGAEEQRRQADEAAGRIAALERQVAEARAGASAGPPAEAPPAPAQLAEQAAHRAALEEELRRSKRREEKLQALLYRLRHDLKSCGGDLAALDDIQERRSLEYELDRLRNRASREKAVLREQLAAALERCAAFEGKSAGAVRPARGILQPKENQHVV